MQILPYHWREVGRMATGAYTLPVWIADRRLAPIPGHFAHVSNENGAQIAYTQSAEKGARDIQTRVRPGKYLAQFYPNLTAPEVSTLAAEYGAAHAPVEFKLATSREDIIKVYRHGPHSCMAGDEAPGVYGAGDLAIAYLGPIDGATARAVCWPKRKIFGRTYGDSIRLQSALESKGYSHADSGAEWYGARLLREEISDYQFRCPYLDVAYHVEDSGEFLVISASGFDARNTSGTVGEAPYTCAGCGTGLDSDEIQTCEGSDYTYCESCFSDRFSYCESCDSYSDSDDFQRVNVGIRRGNSEMYVCDNCASDLIVCRDCDSGADRFDAEFTCEIAGDTYCERHAEDHSECETCADDGAEWHESTDTNLCSDCAAESDRLRADCLACGAEFFKAHEHAPAYCADCGAGEIMLARGAIGAPIARPPAWRGAPVKSEAPEFNRNPNYRIGDIFAAESDAGHILAYVSSVDSAGYVRAFYAPGFGVYCAPIGQRPMGMGAKISVQDPDGARRIVLDATRAYAGLRAAAGRYFANRGDAADIVRGALL